MPPSEPKQWAVARLDEIPDDHPPGWWDHEAATPGFGARWHPVRRHFGIEGFGIAASGADAGAELIVPHTELGNDPEAEYVSGQEEVYFVVKGSGTMRLDGDEVELRAGRFLRVDADSTRMPVAGPDGLEFLTIGAPLEGNPYTPPEWG